MQKTDKQKLKHTVMFSCLSQAGPLHAVGYVKIIVILCKYLACT